MSRDVHTTGCIKLKRNKLNKLTMLCASLPIVTSLLYLDVSGVQAATPTPTRTPTPIPTATPTAIPTVVPTATPTPIPYSRQFPLQTIPNGDFEAGTSSVWQSYACSDAILAPPYAIVSVCNEGGYLSQDITFPNGTYTIAIDAFLDGTNAYTMEFGTGASTVIVDGFGAVGGFSTFATDFTVTDGSVHLVIRAAGAPVGFDNVRLLNYIPAGKVDDNLLAQNTFNWLVFSGAVSIGLLLFMLFRWGR